MMKQSPACEGFKSLIGTILPSPRIYGLDNMIALICNTESILYAINKFEIILREGRLFDQHANTFKS